MASGSLADRPVLGAAGAAAGAVGATPKRIAAALLCAFLLLYSFTAYRGVGGRINYGDSAKWAYLPLVDGTPHPTGYPLFLWMLKGSFALLPLHPVALRATAVSILFGALTVSTAFLLAYQISRHLRASVLAALALGVSYSFWTQSTEAEVYSLNAFFVLLVLLLFTRYHQTQRIGWLLAGAAAYSLSFGNHLTMITLLPALIYLVAATDRRVFLRPGIIVTVLAFIALSAAQYAYLYHLSWDAHPRWFSLIGRDQWFLESLGPRTDLRHLLHYVTGSDYRSQMLGASISFFLEHQLPRFIDDLQRNFTILSVFLGGWAYILLRSASRRVLANALGLAILGEALFALRYDIPDLTVYYIPIYSLLAVLMAGVFADGRALHAKTVMLAAIIASSLYLNFATRDIRTWNHPRDAVRRLVANLPPQAAVLLDPQSLWFGDHSYGPGYSQYSTIQLCNYLNVSGEIPDRYFTVALDDLAHLRHFYLDSMRSAEIELLGCFDLHPVPGAPRILEARANGQPRRNVPADLLRVEPPSPELTHLLVKPAPSLGGIEPSGTTHALWIGAQDAGMPIFTVTASRAMDARFAFQVRAMGPSLPDRSAAPLDILVNERAAANATITAVGDYRFTLPLAAGPNRIALRIPQDGLPPRAGANDSRTLMLYIADVRIGAADAGPATGTAGQPGTSDPGP